MVAGGVTNHTVANQTVPWKQKGAAHWGQQHFFGLGKEPFDGNVTEHWRHGFLQGLYHLSGKNKPTKIDVQIYKIQPLLDQYIKRLASLRYDFLTDMRGRHSVLRNHHIVALQCP